MIYGDLFSYTNQGVKGMKHAMLSQKADSRLDISISGFYILFQTQ
jgi:hypothetical protein